MGDLLVMSHAKTRPACDFVAGHSAEILFFTGVRYYRMDEPATAIVAERATIKRRRTNAQRGAKMKREALA